MIVAARTPLTFRGLGAPNTESHPELVSQAQSIYSAAGFAAACSEVQTPWAPGKAYYNRLCSLDGGPQSHAVDPIAENYGGVLPPYMVQQIRQEVSAEKSPGTAVVVPQGIYTVDSAGKPKTTSFLDALTASGVSPVVAAAVVQQAAPAPVAPSRSSLPGSSSSSGSGSSRDRVSSGGYSVASAVQPVSTPPPSQAVPPSATSPLAPATTGAAAETPAAAPVVSGFSFSSVPAWGWAVAAGALFLMVRSK